MHALAEKTEGVRISTVSDLGKRSADRRGRRSGQAWARVLPISNCITTVKHTAHRAAELKESVRRRRCRAKASCVRSPFLLNRSGSVESNFRVGGRTFAVPCALSRF